MKYFWSASDSEPRWKQQLFLELACRAMLLFLYILLCTHCRLLLLPPCCWKGGDTLWLLLHNCTWGKSLSECLVVCVSPDPAGRAAGLLAELHHVMVMWVWTQSRQGSLDNTTVCVCVWGGGYKYQYITMLTAWLQNVSVWHWWHGGCWHSNRFLFACLSSPSLFCLCFYSYTQWFILTSHIHTHTQTQYSVIQCTLIHICFP